MPSWTFNTKFWRSFSAWFPLCSFISPCGAFVIPRRERTRRGASEEEFYESIGVRIKNHPVPPFLLFLILGFIIWFFFYVIIFGIKGGPF